MYLIVLMVFPDTERVDLPFIDALITQGFWNKFNFFLRINLSIIKERLNSYILKHTTSLQAMNLIRFQYFAI